MSRVSPAEIAVVVGIFACTCLFGFAFQERISVGQGFGYDGWHYGKVARLIQAGEPLAGVAPFVYRPGVPFVVAMTSAKDDVLAGFLRVNVFANFVTVLLLTFWLALFVGDARVRVLMSFLFQAHWIGPVRNVWYYSTLVDQGGHAISLAFLLSAFAWQATGVLRPVVLALLALAGTFVRESLLFLPISLVLVEAKLGASSAALRALPGQLVRGLRIAWLPILAGVGGVLLTHEIAEGSGYPGYRATATWLYYTKSKLAWLYAWAITFGPILALVIYDWKNVGRFLGERPALLVVVLLVAPMSFLGGPDNERFLLWMSPVILVLIGRAIEHRLAILKSPLVWPFLLVTQALAMRLFLTIPGLTGCRREPVFVFLTRIGECVREPDLVSVHASDAARDLGMSQYAAVFVLVIALLAYADFRRKQRQSSAPPAAAIVNESS